MTNCAPEPKVASFLPDFARNAHGNLAEQNRLVGAQHGADTSRPESKTLAASTKSAVEKPAESKANAGSKAVLSLLAKNNCTACHGIDKKIVGPAFTDIYKKYPDKTDYIAKKIKSGGSGVWGPIPMPSQNLSEADALAIAQWITNGASK
jgi:cytochrome c